MGYPKYDYYAYFHSVTAYQQIFWGDSSHSDKIFRLKKIIRIIIGARTRDSCRELFKSLTILPLKSKYIFSLALLLLTTKVYLQKILNCIISKLGITPIFSNCHHI